MIIKELHLTNFGKFNNKKILLDNNMNIIYGKNEAGKSTIFYFIVGMFYGFYKPYIKTRKLLELHETYKPWSGGGYLGNLVFYDEKINRTVQIERNFDQRNESITVIDISTGQDITDTYPIHPIFRLPDIAGVHLGMSYTTFINTLGIKQLGQKTDSNFDKELKESVINALTTRNSDVSIHKVQDKITKELDQIGSIRRKTSNYYLKKQKLANLKIEAKATKEIFDEIIELKEDERKLESDKASIMKDLKKIDRIKQIVAIEKLQDVYDKGIEIELQYKTLTNKKADLKVTEEFSENDIDRVIECMNLNKFIDMQQADKEKEKKSKLKIGYILTGIGLLLAIIGIVLAFVNLWFGLIGVFSIGVAIGSSEILIHKNQVEYELEIEILQSEMEKLNSEILPVTSYYNISTVSKLKEIREKLKQFNNYKRDLNNNRLRFNDLLQSKSLLEIEIELRKLIQNQLEVAENNYQDKDNYQDKIEDEETLIEQLNEIREQITIIKVEAESLSREYREIAEIEEEIIYEELLLNEMNIKKKVYETIRETIDEVTDELQHNFAPLLNKTVSSIIESVTDNKYQDIKINPEMLMRLVDPVSNKTISANQLSCGTVDLFYIALREALASWINKDKQLPMLMDETFAHFDNDRLEAALNLFAKSSHQVILFTCQERELMLIPSSSAIIRL